MIPTLNDLDVTGKRVLVRLDLDVPLDEKGNIIDDTRLRAGIPTLKKLLEKGARQLIIIGHIDRPQGKYDETKSTKPIALRLMKLLGRTVQHVNDCIDIELPPTPIVVLENLRFHAEEEANDETFAQKLASHADVYVNDAFATTHRAHASTVGVTKYLPGGIGLQIEKELKHLQLTNPKRPFIALLGGAKLETKLPLIKRILPRVDKLLLGGAMIFTFYKAKGWETGTSLVDNNNLMMAKMLLHNEKLILPTDVVIAPSPDEGDKAKVVIAQGIPAGMKGLDIGPESIERFKQELSQARTIIWNGPLGYVEKEPFNKATEDIIRHIASLTSKGVTTIVGGGDSIKLVNKLGMASQFTHVSTGGGASMKLLEGQELVALKALEKK